MSKTKNNSRRNQGGRRLRSRRGLREDPESPPELLRQESRVDIIARRLNADLDGLNANFGNNNNDNELSIAADIQIISANLTSDDEESQLVGMKAAREMLRTGSIQDHIHEVVRGGLVPRIVQLLGSTKNPDLMFNALWVLTNVASGTSENTQVVTQSRAIEQCFRCLESDNKDIAEMSCWALSNCIAEGGETRQRIVHSDLIILLTRLLKFNDKMVTRTLAWTILNICSTQGVQPCVAARHCLSVLGRLIATSTDVPVIENACSSLRLLSDRSYENTEEIIIQGMVPRLVHFIQQSDNPTTVVASLRVLGNIVTGSQTQANTVLGEEDAIPSVLMLLSNENSNIVQEATWMLSKVTYWTYENVESVMKHNIVAPLINVIRQGTPASKREALECVRNIAKNGNSGHVIQLCRAEILTILDNLLQVVTNTEDTILLLDILENILLNNRREVLRFFHQNRLDKIVQLQLHEDIRVRDLAHHIITDNFRSNQMDQQVIPLIELE